MNETLQYQLRLTVSASLADAVRSGAASHSHAALYDLLREHNATLKCQFDAFADYVNEAERIGTETYPLYQWTKDTIENPEKKDKYLKSFTIHVDGNEIYGKDVADAIEAGLSACVSDDGILRVSRFDTDPANNPQPPKR
ncbi:MAG TPA: hypothetical protein VFE79_05090 [Paraburkholderia sp.]|nr:hypothetical protein [Paraburkholderia sp.]